MRLIDADEVKRAICQDQCEKPDGCGGSCEMTDYIENATTIEAEPVKHGRWITKTRHEHYPSGKEYEEDFCSACGMRGNIEYDYCPRCGAKMDEVSK